MKYSLLILLFLPALSAAQTRQPECKKMKVRSSTHGQSEHLNAARDDKNVEDERIIKEGGKHGPGVMFPECYARMITFLKSRRK